MIEGRIKGAKKLHRDFKILTLTPEKKKTIYLNTLKTIRKNMLSNKNKQQDPEGRAWTPRKKDVFEEDKKGNKKLKPMLKKIHKKSRIRADSKYGYFEYNNPVSSRIAAEHQYGAKIPIRRKQDGI